MGPSRLVACLEIQTTAYTFLSQISQVWFQEVQSLAQPGHTETNMQYNQAALGFHAVS